MPNISPSLDSRLASIELGVNNNVHLAKSPRSPKKTYPASLYPKSYHGSTATTPSKAPVLSTARRAQSRSLSQSKNGKDATADPSPDRKVLKPNNQVISAIENIDRKTPRKASRYSEASCSFMRDTTSSRKKLHATGKLPTTKQPQYKSQDRSVSHPEFYNKRPCMFTSTLESRLPSGQKTNATINAARKRADSSYINEPPTRGSRRLPCKISQSASMHNVHLRLYNDAMKLVEELATRSTLPRLRISNQLSSLWRDELSTSSQSKKLPKIASLAEMYGILEAADAELFQDFHTLDPNVEANAPILPHQLDSLPSDQLASVYERGEIIRKQHVYFIPKARNKNINLNVFNSGDYKNNFGFDDVKGNYIISLNDHIDYRYEIKCTLGTGSFGNVVLCTDHKYSQPGRERKVAIKIIRNDLNWSLQAVSEIKMLKQLNQRSAKGDVNDHIINYYDHFHFRGHMCIATEVLSLNLFTFLELMSFRGVSLNILRTFATDILRGLKFIHDQKVIHCDVKPENIMIKLPPDFNANDPESIPSFIVKLIDFGSSCLEDDTTFSYIQSRFYRAPEVILGSRYSRKIDIWSLGCVLAELFTGQPILPGRSEVEQIALILELFGSPPSNFIVNEKKSLMRMARASPGNIRDPVSAEASVYGNDVKAPVDEKKIKRTLLYSLFNADGKLNQQVLSQQLIAVGKESTTHGHFKKSVKPSSKSLDVTLRLHKADEPHATSFSRFLTRIFCWNPQERPDASTLLDDAFLK